MNLNLADKLLLLALDDEKGTFNADSLTFNYGIAGAIIYELIKDNSIEISNKKIKVSNARNHTDAALDYCLSKIRESKKERSIKRWIDYFGNRGSRIRKIILEKLIKKGILAEKESTFLWIFPNNKYPSKNIKPENRFKSRLKDIVILFHEPEVDEVMLISLVDSCNLNKEVYGKRISKDQKKRIKEVINSEKFANDTHNVLREIHETIVASIVVLMAASTITSAS